MFLKLVQALKPNIIHLQKNPKKIFLIEKDDELSINLKKNLIMN